MELAEVLIDVTADIATDVAADVAMDVTNRIELKAWVKIRQLKEFKVFNSLRLSVVLLIAICY